MNPANSTCDAIFLTPQVQVNFTELEENEELKLNYTTACATT